MFFYFLLRQFHLTTEVAVPCFSSSGDSDLATLGDTILKINVLLMYEYVAVWEHIRKVNYKYQCK